MHKIFNRLSFSLVLFLDWGRCNNNYAIIVIIGDISGSNYGRIARISHIIRPTIGFQYALFSGIADVTRFTVASHSAIAGARLYFTTAGFVATTAFSKKFIYSTIFNF